MAAMHQDMSEDREIVSEKLCEIFDVRFTFFFFIESC